MGGEGDFTDLEPESFRDELEKLRDSVPSDVAKKEELEAAEQAAERAAIVFAIALGG